jgi:hypothetical protein
MLVVPGMMIFLFIMIAYIYPLFFNDFVSSHIETFKMDYGVEIFSNETTKDKLPIGPNYAWLSNKLGIQKGLKANYIQPSVLFTKFQISVKRPDGTVPDNIKKVLFKWESYNDTLNRDLFTIKEIPNLKNGKIDLTHINDWFPLEY